MKLLICMALVCAGCGPAFTYASVDEALETDGGTDAESPRDAAPAVDSGPVVDGAPYEAAVDAAVLDAGVLDAAPPQDSALIDSAPTCTPFSIGEQGTCMVGGSTEFFAIPSQICETWDGVRTAPATCSDCEEHYTCACLMASVTCAGNSVSCTLVNGNPVLSCQ